MRTKHQQDPKAQLVVRTARAPGHAGNLLHSAAARSAGEGGTASDDDRSADEGSASGDEAAMLDAAAAGTPAGELRGLSDESDVLQAPRLLESGDGGYISFLC